MKRTVALIFLLSCSAFFCQAIIAQQGQQESQNKAPLPLPAPLKTDPGKIEVNPAVLPTLRLVGRPCFGDSPLWLNDSYEVVKQEPEIGVTAKDYPVSREINMGSTGPDELRFNHRIIFDEVKYDVTVNHKDVIRRISTSALNFKTPEGIAVGDSLDKVLKFSKGERHADRKPCLYYVELKSGWRALFSQGEVRQDGTLAPEARVVAFFRERVVAQ